MNKKIHLIKTFTDCQGGYAVESITDSTIHPAMLRSVFAVELWYLYGSDVIYLAVPSKYLKHFVRKNQEYLRNTRKYAAFAA